MYQSATGFLSQMNHCIILYARIMNWVEALQFWCKAIGIYPAHPIIHSRPWCMLALGLLWHGAIAAVARNPETVPMLPSVVHHPRLTAGSYDTAPAGSWPGTATRVKTVVPRLGIWRAGSPPTSQDRPGGLRSFQPQQILCSSLCSKP